MVHNYQATQQDSSNELTMPKYLYSRLFLKTLKALLIVDTDNNHFQHVSRSSEVMNTNYVYCLRNGYTKCSRGRGADISA
jgi:hypothetical protein